MSWICPECRTENSYDSTKCKKCNYTYQVSINDNVFYEKDTSSDTQQNLFDYAGLWRRVAAYIIDIFVFIIFYLSLTIILSIILNPISISQFDKTILNIGLTSLTSFCFFWLYHAIMESSKLQATVGKMFLKIIVTNVNGERISFIRATLRFIIKLILFSLQAFIGGIGMLLEVLGFGIADFTKKRQAIHDILLKTLVIKKKSLSIKSRTLPSWGISQIVSGIVIFLFCLSAIFNIINNDPTQYMISKANIEKYLKQQTDEYKKDQDLSKYLTYQNNHYKINYPSSWNKLEYPQQNSVHFVSKQTGSFIEVSAKKIEDKSLSLDNIANLTYQRLIAKKPQYKDKIKLSKNATIGNNPAFMITVPSEFFKTESELLQYSTVKDNFFYTIISMDNNSLGATNKIIESFRFINEN